MHANSHIGNDWVYGWRQNETRTKNISHATKKYKRYIPILPDITRDAAGE